MPELPEIRLYLHALERFIVGHELIGIRLRSPSLLKTFDPPLRSAHGRTVVGVERIGKRVVWELTDDLFLVFHLMVTGRYHWKKPGTAIPRKRAHGAFDFAHGTLMLTEAGREKKASLHVVAGRESLRTHDPGGVEPLECSLEQFSEALTRENRTLKRALTDPRLLSGIGNAHSDEILHEAHLSPVQRTGNLSADEIARLFEVTRTSLERWSHLLIEENADRFPERVTAFHPAMRVHGRFREPCPECEAPVQRIVYASRETNYCARCQTGGRVLADRSLSRLLRDDWPATVEELEGTVLDGSGS